MFGRPMTLTARFHSSPPLAGIPPGARVAPLSARAGRSPVRALLLIQAALPRTAAADTPRAEEYQVKAAFILNFAGFVDWPDPPRSNDLFTIAILGATFEGASIP